MLGCETDFVAKPMISRIFAKKWQCRCVEDYSDAEELLQAEYIRDPKKILDLVNETTAKVGEK